MGGGKVGNNCAHEKTKRRNNHVLNKGEEKKLRNGR